MKRKFRTIGLLLAIMFSMTMMTAPVLAANQAGISVPVPIRLEGTLPDTPENFKVVLTAENSAYPMPVGAVDGVAFLTYTGAGSDFFVISYDRVGIYTYMINQMVGSDSECTYDSSVYLLTVAVTNAEDGSGLEVAAVLYPDAKSDKQSGAEFVNTYPAQETTQETTAEPEPSDAPKTGDESEIEIWICLFLLSAIVTAFGIWEKRKHMS